MAKKPVVKKQAVPLYDELCGVANMTLDDGESYQDFAVRLGQAISVLDEDAYGKLSPLAVKWFTNASDSINAEKDAPDLPGFPKAEEEAAEDESVEEEEVAEDEGPPEDEEPTKEPSKKKAAVKKAEKEVKPVVKPERKVAMKKASKSIVKPAVKKEASAPKKSGADKKPRTDGAAYKIRVAVIKSPNISFGDACVKVGIKAEVGGYLWNRWHEARSIMSIINAK